MAVCSGVDGAATDVGARAGGVVDVNVSAVIGRAGGSAGDGVDVEVSAVGGRADGGVTAVGGSAGVTVINDVDVTAVGGRAGGGVTAVGGSAGVAVISVVDVTAVGGRAGGGVTAVGGSAGMAVISDVDVTAVGGRAGGGVGAAVSSDFNVVVSCTAIVVEVDVVGCAPMEQRHGSTGYSRRGSVAGVDPFRVVNSWQRRGRREAWFQAFCFANLVRGIRQTATKLAIFGVQKASLNMFWEYSPSSENIVSDWLRAESSPADEEKINLKNV